MPVHKSFFKKFPASVWIETGTYEGDGVNAALNSSYEKIYSIELSEEFFQKCMKKFSTNKKVDLRQGNSAKILKEILNLNEKIESIVFWLDAHYSGEKTAGSNQEHPLLEEISSIFEWKKINKNVKITILIDDLRTFIPKNVGFSTKDILTLTNSNFKNAEITYEDGYQEHTGHVFKDDILVIKI